MNNKQTTDLENKALAWLGDKTEDEKQ